MKFFSEKINYSIAAMFELARRYRPEHYVQIKTLAEQQNIPPNYLVQLLVVLKRWGLVKSTRGTTGGYCLSKSPDQITLLEIIQALDSPLKLIDFTGNSIALNIFWREQEERIKQLFQISLEKVISQELLIQKNADFRI